jgi:hypothetical protein
MRLEVITAVSMKLWRMKLPTHLHLVLRSGMVALLCSFSLVRPGSL